MSTVTDLDISKYKCYYFTDKLEDFTLFAVRPAGEEEYTEYDKYITENGTLICFKEYDDTKRSSELHLRTSTDVELIQAISYETFFANVDKWDNDDFFCYIYGDSVDVTNSVKENLSTVGKFNPLSENRCDYGEYGFRIFFVTDGIKNFTVDVTKQTKENIKYAYAIISVPGVASILAIGHNTPTPTDIWPVHSIVGKTFYGVLKTIIEWSQVAEEPWDNTELPAIRAKQFLNSLSFGEDLIQEIETKQNDMAVKKFLTDTENARVSDELTISISDALKNHLSNKFRFKTLNNLVKYKNINISQDILDKELIQIEQDLYSFCILNNISLNDIESLLSSSSSDLNFELSSKIQIENQFFKFKTIKGI